MNEQNKTARAALTDRPVAVSLNMIALCTTMVLSYLLTIFSEYTSSGMYVVTLVFFVLLFVITTRWQRFSILSMSLLWGPAMLIMLISFLRSSHTITGAFDVVVLLISVMLCIFVSNRERTYESVIVTMACVSAVYAMGVFLQCFFPTVFSLLLKAFPATMAEKITEAKGVPGFTTNIGFSANYICTGMIAILALSIGTEKKSEKAFTAVTMVFLVLCLLLTGKRGHKLFIYLALLICFMLPAKKQDILKRCGFVLLATVLLFFFSIAVKYFAPEKAAVTTIMDNVEDLQGGKDITSSRLKLYAWALKLFAENPVLGIGWGDYRTTVVGNATVIEKLDTHNIYLQLLAENGIVGFLCFAVPMLLFWVTTLRLFYYCVHKKIEVPETWRKLLFFSFAYQTFFGLLGLTENPLYDVRTVLPYLLSCGIVVAYFIRSKAKRYPAGKKAVLHWFTDSFFGPPAGIESAEEER